MKMTSKFSQEFEVNDYNHYRKFLTNESHAGKINNIDYFLQVIYHNSRYPVTFLFLLLTCKMNYYSFIVSNKSTFLYEFQKISNATQMV